VTKDHNEHLLPDVDDDKLAITTGPGILGSHKNAVAEFIVADDGVSWCPNADQLRALRDQCSAILAAHAAKNVAPPPYKLERFVGIGGATIEVESGGNIHSIAEGAIIRIDIQGNDDGPAWVGGLDDLAFLSSAIDDIWDRYNPPTPSGLPLLEAPLPKELLRALDDMEALGELVADKAGNLCTLEGKVIATGDPLWLRRVANVVNMVNMLPQIAKLERDGSNS
jgi:hypothetical protein